MHACTNTVQAYPMLYAPSRTILFKSRSTMMKVPVLPIPALQRKQVKWTNSLELAGTYQHAKRTYAHCNLHTIQANNRDAYTLRTHPCAPTQTTTHHTTTHIHSLHTHACMHARTHARMHTHLQCTTTGPGDNSNSLSCFCCWLTSSR